MVSVKGDSKVFDKQNKELEMIRMEGMYEISQLEPQGKYNIREPPVKAGESCFDHNGLDMIVLPGMGFTANCERIGHGKGFYDCFVTKHMAWSAKHGYPKPFLVAVGAEQQLVTDLPVEKHDRVLDAVIIDDQLFRHVD
ncbi:hypothetical protein TRICI_005550 [Trichomonascus ciferrii]|uniref:5-formyltetrahydrofolate cyclo-ligase n=1 Tax=Trichomonascus ciferrii TaxID=44093 RepID=A0A642UU39_9ASCO|nr:hypothetical protein TRICI_005550 [Trichomonascus ciferrii]